MKWLKIQTWKFKKQAKECWHCWFAWYPVATYNYSDGAKQKTWLQQILRKGKYKHETWDGSRWIYPCWVYQYKIIEKRGI